MLFCVKGEKLAKALTNRKYSDIIDNGFEEASIHVNTGTSKNYGISKTRTNVSDSSLLSSRGYVIRGIKAGKWAEHSTTTLNNIKTTNMKDHTDTYKSCPFYKNPPCKYLLRQAHYTTLCKMNQ